MLVLLVSCLVLHLHTSEPYFVTPEVKVIKLSQECQVSQKFLSALDKEAGRISHRYLFLENLQNKEKKEKTEIIQKRSDKL